MDKERANERRCPQIPCFHLSYFVVIPLVNHEYSIVSSLDRNVRQMKIT